MKKQHRSPVIVVLGHVDHGKTTLLDFIRSARKADKEVGGITQSIGAYEVTVPVSGYHTDKITFIDTPGHEAFTKLRLHGATVADVAVLIIAADDSIMPQTKESIFHIHEAGIPFIVAVNKIDLPGANVEKVKKDLLRENVQIEGMGGTVPIVPISAKTGDGVSDLLEAILLVASDLNLELDTDGELDAPIIEVGRDKAGILVSAIIKRGRLSVGEKIYAGEEEARVRALIADNGKNLHEVTPATPFVLLGFSKEPEVGRSLSRLLVKGEKSVEPGEKSSTDLFGEEKKKLKIILKADSQGSLEAINTSLTKNGNVKLILSAVGEVNKSDIFLAKVSSALVIGFSVKVDRQVEEVAKQEKVIIKTYNIIYELLDELTEVSDLLHEKQEKEKNLKGEAKIVATFAIGSDRIAGFQVTKGKISEGDSIEIIRGGRATSQSKITSLKQRTKSVSEVKKNEEGGAFFEPILDFAIGDVIKSYSI